MIVSAQVAIYPLRQERLTPAITAVSEALDARRPLLGHARDFTLRSLRALASAAAGPRFPNAPMGECAVPRGLPAGPRRIPLGAVIGVSVELAP